ncbi:Uncharacterized protein ALO68_01425 [Pseudomonas syringae pv. helianthi]|uniref:GAF domain-containing protein n=1 Tax=Pseudomonas syringae pv. helianthi TaxID=251654 RepID=A0A0P9VYC4_9PSED|nr:hypothetical protein [Pseudomonas syringae group genomosp. 7]KPX43160.1 Uncharacterized protein ALO68_01425 [Pseudomonas syringae pv. helianthi]UNB64676.1 hypothetical protein MME54_07850 [Pseudomonas syringae pv. helianthi]
MQRPVVGDNWGKACARSIVKISESWLVKTILKPILFLLPPTLLTTIATRQGLPSNISQYIPSNAASFINDSAIAILIGAYIYIVIIKALYSLIYNYSKPSRELLVSDILAINKAFEIIVSDKYKRMSDEAKIALKSTNMCPSSTFMRITKPEQQIALLVSGVRRVFEQIDETDALFRVGLLKVENNKSTEWVCFEPMSHPPRTEASQLASPYSTVSLAIKRKTIIVIEDIQRALSVTEKDKKRYLESNTQKNDQGSQLCYPIIHAGTGKIEYVLSIAGNKKGCLIEKHAALYAWILEQFAIRIALEHSLIILKEKVNER